jgi:hypothetical protein
MKMASIRKVNSDSQAASRLEHEAFRGEVRHT